LNILSYKICTINVNVHYIPIKVLCYCEYNEYYPENYLAQLLDQFIGPLKGHFQRNW